MKTVRLLSFPTRVGMFAMGLVFGFSALTIFSAYPGDEGLVWGLIAAALAASALWGAVSGRS